MRLNDETYEYIKQEVANMFVEYDIKGTPISSFEVAIKIGLTVIPYSALNRKARRKAISYSEDGYSLETNNGEWIIYYNDIDKDYSRINQTIMHEVGHNFYCALNHRFGVLNKVFYTYLFFVDILRFSSANDLLNFALMTDIGKVYKKFEKYCRDNKVIIINLIDTVENCYSLYKTVEGVFDNIKDKLTLGLMTLLGASIITAFKMFNIWTWLFLPLSLNNEKTADNFATIYGYGPALSSALNKLETASPSELDKAFDKIPFLSNLYSINTSLAYIIIGGIDGHPETVTRMYDQLELLKREANKEDLDPKMRKVILKDIADCEKVIKETTTLNDGIKDKELVSKLYSKFLHDNLKSKRLKDMIFDDRLRFSGYDKVYDKALNK